MYRAMKHTVQRLTRRRAAIPLLALGLVLAGGCRDSEPSPADTAEGLSTPAVRATATQASPTAAPTTVALSPLETASQPESVLPAPTSALALYTAQVVNVFPHDRQAFTQGLVYMDGVFYEGTGLLGRSSLRRVDPGTGTVLQQRDLDETLFGEGIAVVDDRIYQLTWHAGRVFLYDRESFVPLDEFRYDTEGWGLTYDGERLIMSDGTPNLYFRDPETFAETGRVEVRDANGPIAALNELEYVNGRVFANVWQTDLIAIIDPATGWVTGWIGLAGLLSAEDTAEPVDVLNGIAYDPEQDRLFVTGKLWPKLFEIELVPYQ